MSKGTRFVFSLCGAVIGALTLWLFAAILLSTFILPISPELGQIIVFAAGVIGAILGAIYGTRIIKQAQSTLLALSAEQLGTVLVGVLLSALAAALIAWPFSYLPAPLGQVVPLFVALAVVYLGTVTLRDRPHDIISWVKNLRPVGVSAPMPVSAESSEPAKIVLLDTSVIIDGRITDISKTGFVTTTLSVPNFVLTELQHIADSPDPIRRKRGRRGLEVLNVLRNDCPIPFEVTDVDVSEVREVDSKLIALARHLSVPIMTNDYNLNRVAGVQGVTVLNINDLANAVKAAYLPGEELLVKVIQEGREQGQGVGYLDDGTMVVVEEGQNFLNETLDVVVTKVLQTSAGRMIFSKAP